MITKEQLLNGLVTYADNEILPHLPTIKQWGAGAGTIIILERANSLVDSLVTNPVVKQLGLINDTGMIDSDYLISALSKSAEKYGRAEIAVPFIGTLAFTVDDVRKLGTYLNGGM